ncbi:MAG: hypothetical protein J6T41_00190 [Neisseriaceae bacterium]|nr:hypothetical protein [Neisseriaceae bacterium]
MSIDRADWHWEDTEKLYRQKHHITSDLTDEMEDEIWKLAGNHIGLFLQWIIENHFEGKDNNQELCEQVRNGKITGTEYFIEDCDCKFWECDVCEEILPFVQYYYEKNDFYLNDYVDCCTNDEDKPLYHGVISDINDYALLRQKINQAFEEFVKS